MRNTPDDDTGFESIRELAAGLVGLNRRAVEEYTPLVEDILRFGNRDVHYIEHTLDGLLDFCGSAAALALYKKLCRYYWDIDPAATADYVRAYREMWEHPDDDAGKGRNEGGDA